MTWTPRQSRLLGTSDGAPATAGVIANPRRVRSVQPQSATSIDYSNPLCLGLVTAFVFSNGFRDLVTGNVAINRGVSRSVGPLGVGITCDTAGIQIPWDIGVPTEDVTITVIEHRVVAPPSYWMIADNRATGSGYIYGADGMIFNPWGVLTAPGYKVTSYCKSEFYQNKVKTNAAIGTAFSPRIDMRLFGRYTDADSYRSSVIYACYIHKRNISQMEHNAICDNPFQIFTPASSPIWGAP
jgi:hypothetical protein